MQDLKENKIISEEVAFQGKWLGLSKINCLIRGQPLLYESAFRPTTKRKAFSVDGVEVIPIIRRKDRCSEVVIIANFRPATGKFCLEFPAGLVENQNFQENAMRELKEETGYVGERIIKIPSIPMHCDPWKSSEGGYLYIGIINGDDPAHNKSQELENSENIRVHHFKLDSTLAETVSSFLMENDYIIASKVWAFCLGFNFDNFFQI